MRFVDRSEFPAPEFLKSDLVRRELERARAHFDDRSESARQVPFDFVEFGRSDEPRASLERLFDGKCAFCESQVSRSRSRVHRFRPLQDAVGLPDAQESDSQPAPSREHYWWLAYEWENFYLACIRCARAARHTFPIGSGSRLPRGARPAEGFENALLVDPCLENPADHMLFTRGGFAHAVTDAGATTIAVFELNREELVSARRRAVALAVEELRSAGRSREEVFAVIRARPYSAAVAQTVAFETGSTVADILPAPTTVLKRTAMSEAVEADIAVGQGEIVGVRIANFRGIESLDLDFPTGESRAPWLAVIGENGLGKSSLLQALALALMGTEARELMEVKLDEENLTLGWFVRAGADAAEVEVRFANRRYDRTLRVEPSGFVDVVGDDHAYAVAAYGAGRVQPLFGEPPMGDTGEQGVRVDSLFNAGAALTPTNFWTATTAQRRPDRYPYVARVLSRLAFQEPGAVSVDESGKVRLVVDGVERTLDQMSDGYRSTLAVAVDLMRFFMYRFGSMEAARGVVLIDELEGHLHPRWQMQVVELLRETFPRLQFVVTTHAPLCLRGLEDDEVVVMTRTDDGAVFAVKSDELPPVSQLDAGQLLTSEVFGLNSTMSPAVDQELRDWQDTLARSTDDSIDPSERQRAAEQIEERRSSLVDMGVLGTTGRERLALEVVDEFMASWRQEPQHQRRIELRSDLRSELERVWRGEQDDPTP